MSKKTHLAEELALAVRGVMLPSERDSSFTVMKWPNAALPKDAAAFRKLIKADTKTPVEPFDAEAVLQRLGREAATDGADVKKMKAKLRKLTAFLDEHFDELAGYRVGKINLDTYILGATSEDEVVGLKATGVET
jgi:hypothetical protein